VLSGLCGIIALFGCSTGPSGGFGGGNVSEAVPENALRFAPRIALVIGNDRYTQPWDMLHQSANDAISMAATLKAGGFTLIGGEPQLNVGAVRFRQLVAETAASVQAHPGAIVTVYFSGHGFAFQGNNMLVPVDAPRPSNATTASASIEVIAIAQAISSAGSSLTIMFLDACREAIGGTGGFVDVPPPSRTFIGFGAYFGSWSTEGNGQNSNYTAALLETLKSHWDTLADLQVAVASRVSLQTRYEQTPVYRAAPGMAGSQAHIALNDAESIYAHLLKEGPTSPYQSILAARCAALGSLNLLLPPGSNLITPLPKSDPRFPDMNLVVFSPPASRQETLSVCRDAYSAGARDPATIRGYSMAVLAAGQTEPMNPSFANEVVQAMSLLVQAAENGDGIAETFLAMTEAGVPHSFGNVPKDLKLAGQRLLHAVEVDRSPVAPMVGLGLIKSGAGWAIDEFGLGQDPARGFRIIVDAARRHDPFALQILISHTPEALGYAEAARFDVRSLLHESLEGAPPVDALGAIAFSGLTPRQTLYTLAMLDAVGDASEPADFPTFVRLAVILEPWYPKLIAIYKSQLSADSVGCALFGGIRSTRPMPAIPHDPQMARRFFQMAAEAGVSRARVWLDAIDVGGLESCTVNGDTWPN
jgi:hypothetical protein